MSDNSSNKKHSKKSKKNSFKELAFKFPIEGSFSKVEIPFAFQNNLEEKNPGNKFHSYIKIKDTPTLYIDISNNSNVDKLLLASTIESLKALNRQLENKLQELESKISSIKSGNDNIREEITKKKEEIKMNEKKISYLNMNIKQNEDNSKKIINEISKKNEFKEKSLKALKEKFENTNKELKENTTLNKELYINSILKEINKYNTDYLNSEEFFLKKFENNYYDDKYIQNCLQRDLLDFNDYVKEKLKSINLKIIDLIKLIQDSVNESIGKEYEVKLYGSHATNLCLPWSDLDVVICKRDNTIGNSYTPLYDLFKNLQDKNYFKNINYIGATTVPLIKIKTNGNFGVASVDISLQDNNHYGIQCVSLVNFLIQKYPSLTHLVLALKHILKQANLNDPYKGGLSSYGLILLIVNFLKIQLKNGKSIQIENGNLGRLFYEFLIYYGMEFNPNNTIIDTSDKLESMPFFDRNLYFSQQSDLIIIDPLNPNNNIGKNTRQFNNIKLAFMIGFIVSKEECECGCHFQSQNSIDAQNMEHCILKRIFNGVKRFGSDYSY